MTAFVLPLLIGVIAGLRAMTAPAAVSWAAHLGWLKLESTSLAFLGYAYTPWIFTVFAIGELITDQLPKTPSRKVPPQFIARLLTGGFAGAVIGSAFFHTFSATGAGVIGAVLGTLAGAELRSRLAASNNGNDRPGAFIEDVVAVGGGLLVAFLVSFVS